MRTLLAVALTLIATLPLLVPFPGASAAPPPAPSLSVWSYTFVAPGTAPPGFEQPGPTPPGWGVGVAPFTNRHPHHLCLHFPPGPTYFPENIELLARRSFAWDGLTSGITLEFIADNDIEIYVNGWLVHQGQYGYCGSGPTVFVPWYYLVPGENLLAVRVVDNGGLAYFDMWVVPTP